MAHYAVTFVSVRCPDGAEFAPHPQVDGTTVRGPDSTGGPVIRFRSDTREKYRRRLEAPDDLIVTAFLNAAPKRQPKSGVTDYRGFVEFIGEYGLPYAFMAGDFVKRDPPLPKKPKMGMAARLEHFRLRRYAIPLLAVQLMWRDLHNVWDAYAHGKLDRAVSAFKAVSSHITVDLYPDIQLRDGFATLTLPVTSLLGFMMMETALVLTGGAEVKRCEKCGVIFVTGPGTGRRGTAMYCSNRCRVAA